MIGGEQMKLLMFELKKLSGVRYLWVLLALLLAGSAFYYYYLDIGPDSFMASNYDREANELLSDFIRRIDTEPEAIEAIRKDYMRYREEADRVSEEIKAGMTDEELVGFRVTEEMLAEHGVTYEDKLGYYRSDGTPVIDGFFFDSYENLDNIKNMVVDHIDDIIEVTNGAIRRCENSGATELPVYEYERHFNSVYTSLKENISFKKGQQYGWEIMLYYTEFPVFMFLFLLLAADVIFLYDRSVGFMPVIRTTRGGRIRTASAKFGALLIVSVGAALLFTAAEIVTTYAVTGLSPVDMNVQFMRWDCPYPVTVGGYFVLLVLMRVLAAAAFSCVAAVVPALTFSHAATYIAGAVFIALNVAVSSFPSAVPNLVDMANETFISRYSEILIFGHYYSTLAVSVLAAVAVAAASGVVLIVFGGRRTLIPTPKRRGLFGRLGAIKSWLLSRADSAASLLRGRVGGRRGCRCGTSLFRWELGRLMSPGNLFLLALLFILSIVRSSSVYDAPISSTWLEYENFAAENYFGEYKEESAEQIRSFYNEQKFLASPEGMEYMADEYGKGNISWDEYKEFLISRDKILSGISSLESLNGKMDYLETLRRETGITGWIIPETMLLRLLDRNVNFLLLAAIIIVFSRMYAADYAKKSSEGEFSAILRTTKRGRRELFYARFAAAASVSLALAVIFEGADLIYGIIRTDYLAKVLGAPVSSLERYSSLGGMSVGAYLVVNELLRILPYVLLAFLCCSASFALKRTPPALFSAAAFTLLPYALLYMGQQAMKYVDVTAMLAGGRLLTRSAELAAFGGKYAFAVIFVGAFAALAFVFAFLVRRRTGK